MHHGAHLGVAGGAHKALERARAIGATSLQIFTQSPRMWRHPAVDLEAAARFKAARKPARVAVVVCHATYLINLGASDREVYAKSARPCTTPWPPPRRSRPTASSSISAATWAAASTPSCRR